MVRSGKDKGKTGKVLATHPAENKVTVEGVNIVKKHLKPNRSHPQGGIVEMTKPVWVGKVGITDAAGKKPVRIGYKLLDNKKARVYKDTGKEIQ